MIFNITYFTVSTRFHSITKCTLLLTPRMTGGHLASCSPQWSSMPPAVKNRLRSRGAGHRLTQTHMAQQHLVPDSCRVHGKPSVPTPQLPTLGMG